MPIIDFTMVTVISTVISTLAAQMASARHRRLPMV
jgi:hypothetical protein